ncbi:MAG TPA: hypothetical protein VFD33_06955 [Bacillota bacterium]|nr:hypothetical protein [Bacillota bacterium]
MGVKFAREYSEIIDELAKTLVQISGANDLFDMDEDTWFGMDGDGKHELTKTMADDIFFALGEERSASISVGNGLVEYDKNRHIIKVTEGVKIVLIDLV